VAFLRRLIRFYGDQMQGFLPPYLEMSMENFSKAPGADARKHVPRLWRGDADGRVRGTSAAQHGDVPEAMKVWAPFATAANATPAAPEAESDASKDEQLAELRQQMAAMQKQLDAMSRGKG
jgi:polyhydroxyalkanoate synthesis regulator protein